jgi:sugar O-acyltransferase (sialic acid O-acetyltransferase NeuD family)
MNPDDSPKPKKPLSEGGEKSLVIWGAGDHAKALVDELMRGVHGNWKATAVVYPDESQAKHYTFFKELGMDVWREREAYRENIEYVALGIGDNDTRQVCYRFLASEGYQFPDIISIHAQVSPTSAIFPNAGVQVFSGAFVGPSARIEAGCILNHGSIVEHDANVGAYSHVAPRATLLGGAKLGHNCFMGAASTLLPYVETTHFCILGAGAVVTHSLPEPGIYTGVPARREAPSSNIRATARR